MKEPKFIAFSTQKGGAGKTTLTVTVASYLYYCKGKKVLVVDCDYPQHSIDEMRNREKMLLDINPAFSRTVTETFRRTKLKPFPVLVCAPEEAMQKVRVIVEESEDIDYVFFDLPGTVNNHGVVNVVNCMDVVFIPIAADNVVLESSLAFALRLNELLTTGKSHIKELYMLWNMVDAREKTDLYDRYEKLFEELGLATLRTKIPDTKKFRREGSQTLERAVFRSTVMPPDKTLLKGTRLTELAEEILKILKD